MHDMLPPDLAVVSQVLFELLELREHVCVVSSVHVSPQKRRTHPNEFLAHWRARFYQGAVQTLQNARIRLSSGKTATKLFALTWLGLLLSEKQIPQVVEKLERGCKSKEPLERTVLVVRQAL